MPFTMQFEEFDDSENTCSSDRDKVGKYVDQTYENIILFLLSWHVADYNLDCSVYSSMNLFDCAIYLAVLI